MPTDLIEHSVSSNCSDSRLICLFISPLVPLSPVVGLRPPSNSFILSFRLTTHAAVQNTIPEGVLSQCWCSLTLILTTTTSIWRSVGVTKGVTSPAAHRGIWHVAGAMKGVTSPAAHRGIWHVAGAMKGVTSPAAHRGIWHVEGAKKSWFSVLSMLCSWLICVKLLFILSFHLTMPAISLFVLSETKLQKAFSLNAGALSL